jgi:hypothetical protein
LLFWDAGRLLFNFFLAWNAFALFLWLVAVTRVFFFFIEANLAFGDPVDTRTFLAGDLRPVAFTRRFEPFLLS